MLPGISREGRCQLSRQAEAWVPGENFGARARRDLAEAKTHHIEPRALAEQVRLGPFLDRDGRVQVQADRLGEGVGAEGRPTRVPREALRRFGARESETGDLILRREAIGNSEVVEQARDVEQLGVERDPVARGEQRALEVGAVAVVGERGGRRLGAERGSGPGDPGLRQWNLRQRQSDLFRSGKAEPP